MSQHTQLSPLATKVHSIYKNMAQASPTPLVEIHAVRGEINDQNGPEWASHESFDQAVHECRRQGLFRMLSISNPGKATKEQIQDSIPGEYELFFYLIKV